MLRWHVVSAVFWRNVKQYFSGPLGYLFIVVFVTVCSVMAFSPQFFADNLANLDQLSRWFPMLLLFFIPAITMTVWADEKRQGTDSILFTLPASDFDILLGKYLAVVAVYSIALFFSLSQLVVLKLIGDPDWGVIFATYMGYWLAGLALLSIGMFASSLTGSATVAFVVGAILCAVPVLIGQYFRGIFQLERFGFDWNLHYFTIGLIPLTSVAYFLSLTVFMLYLNLIVISRRHWYRGQRLSLGGQFFLRSISLGIALIAFCYLCSSAVSSMWSRADLTHEKLYTLNQATIDTLNKVKENDRSVTIQAFVSSDVPRKFVTTKKQFVGLLRQFSEFGGGNVTVRFVDVTPNSHAELEAQQSGILPQNDRSEVGGKIVEQEVFLGATISTSLGDVTIPIVNNDSSIEYELSRSIATTADKKQQITLGILETDTHFGGPVFQGRRMESEWVYNKTMSELKKQFRIKHIAQADLATYVEDLGVETADKNSTSEEKGANAKKTKVDVMLVADPSSLDDVAMDALVKYVSAGNPTIILADPLPFFFVFQHPTRFGVFNAPRQPRASRSPYAHILTSSSMPKSTDGTASKLLKAIGVEWDNGAAAWSLIDPHANFKGQWQEEFLGPSWPEYYGPREKAFVFVRDHGDFKAFNKDNLLSGGLNELLMFYPGSIRKSIDSKLEFQSLVKLGKESGSIPWDKLTKSPAEQVRKINPRTGEMTTESRHASNEITGEDLVVVEPFPQTMLDDEEHILAARITSKDAAGPNVVFISDMDFVSDLYYQQEAALGQKLDNLALLQNSIEVLAGNEGFVALRNRRIHPRTLVKLETVFESYRVERAKQQQVAEKTTRDAMEVEQKKLNEATKEIQANESLSFMQKIQQASQEASDAGRRLDLRQRKLERDLKDTIAGLETDEQNRISSVENWTRYTSIITAPLPAFALGIFVLMIRYLNEQKNITPERRV